MKEIKLTDKILNLTHKDLDGVVCSILLKNLFKNITIITTNFEDINKYLVTIDYNKYDWVFVTDLHPMSIEYLENPKIILLDHHSSAKEFHDPSKNRFVISKNACGSNVTKRFLERYFKIDLSKFNSLVYLTKDFDLWIHNNKKSKMLNELFYRYWEEKFSERFADGNTRFTKDEINYIRKKIYNFNEIYNNLEIYELPKIKGCLITPNDFSNDCCDKLLKSGYKVVISLIPKSKHVSIRHSIENFHMGNFLKLLKLGGGHHIAAGFTEDDFSTVQERVEKFVNTLSEIIIFEED